MRKLFPILVGVSWPLLLAGQTADELVAKNLEARGGIANIKAIKTLRMAGRVQMGGMTAKIAKISMAPNFLRQTFTIQGMAQVQSYDGSAGWQISPFEGRKDPELLGEDELRGIVEDADFYGPLVDYKTKDNRIEYLGHGEVDGDDAYRIKVTLANGDILNYYLDPDTYLEIRIEKMEFVRGSVNESVVNMGSYKKVAGVYFPFSMEFGSSRQDSADFTKVILDTVEANVPLEASQFKMPVVKPAAPGGKEF